MPSVRLSDEVGRLVGLSLLGLTELQVVRQAGAEELLFNVTVAAVLFSRRSLPQTLVQNELVQVAQVTQVFDGAKGVAQGHGEEVFDWVSGVGTLHSKFHRAR